MKDKEKQKEKDRLLDLALLYYGGSILKSAGMEKEKSLIQHGTVSTYQHSVNVARTSLKIARRLNLTVDERQMVRGALLHDYYLYDWHDKEARTNPHGFVHPRIACENATRDFQLNPLEQNIIRRHMFPSTPIPPKYKEGWVICMADKLCSIQETLKLGTSLWKPVQFY